MRPDALLVTLWLWAAVAVLPGELRRGGEALSSSRIAWGSPLLVAMLFCKPSGLVLAGPLVLAWLWVDRGSALKLAGVVAGLAGLAVLILTLLSQGGYLQVASLWRFHGLVRGQATRLVTQFVTGAAPVLVLLAFGMARAASRRRGLWRDPALALCAGGLAIYPALGKAGVTINSLLPLFLAVVVMAGRSWGGRTAAGERSGESLGTAALVVVTLGYLLFRPVRLPLLEDRLTSQSFYGYVEALSRIQARPALALTPDYVYFRLHQPVEMHGSSFPDLWAAGVPGIETLRGRIEEGAYGVVVLVPHYLPEDGNLRRALLARYRQVADCRLGFYYGHVLPYLVLSRIEGPQLQFVPEAYARCFTVP